MKKRYLILTLVPFLPKMAYAEPEGLLKWLGGNPAENISDVYKLIENAKNIVLYAGGVAAVAMFLYGGYMLLVSGGSEEKAKKAREIITAAVVGIMLILFAQVLVYWFAKALGGGIS